MTKEHSSDQAARIRSEYLTALSHELRTPLNAIVGFTGTLLMQLPGPLNDEQQRQLGLVQASARSLLALINDLLQLSRIDAGRLTLKPEPVDLCRLLRDTADSLQPLADRKQLTLRLALPETGCIVNVDRRALGQILINLTGNAIKYTEQGSVELTVKPGTDPAWPAEVCVVDTGPGIPVERQAELFRPFVRFGDDDPGDGSTGIGLHLSQRLAELCGAEITLRSAPGAGSEFCIRLPAAPP